MGDISVTVSKVGVVDLDNAEVLPVTLLVAATIGQPLYLDPTTAKYGVADANDGGKEQFRGVALQKGAAGQTIDMLKRGDLYGYDLSGMNYDAIAYLSDTAGSFATSAGTKTVNCGRVRGMNDSSKTKVLHIDADWVRNW